MLCVDEKSQIQALDRTHAEAPPLIELRAHLLAGVVSATAGSPTTSGPRRAPSPPESLWKRGLTRHWLSLLGAYLRRGPIAVTLLWREATSHRFISPCRISGQIWRVLIIRTL